MDMHPASTVSAFASPLDSTQDRSAGLARPEPASRLPLIVALPVVAALSAGLWGSLWFSGKLVVALIAA